MATVGLALSLSPAARAGLLTPFLHSPEPAIEGGVPGESGDSSVPVAEDLNPCEQLFEALIGQGDTEVPEGLSEAELQALYESGALPQGAGVDDSGSLLCSPLGMTAGGLGVGGLLAGASSGGGSSGGSGSSFAASSSSSVEAATTPAPEPASAALFALGSLVVGWSVRRRS
jgi:hypothetical protein